VRTRIRINTPTYAPKHAHTHVHTHTHTYTFTYIHTQTHTHTHTQTHTHAWLYHFTCEIVCVILAYYYGTFAGGVTNTLETPTFERPAQMMCSQNTALPVFNQTLQHTAAHCNTLHHNATHCGSKCCALRVAGSALSSYV